MNPGDGSAEWMRELLEMRVTELEKRLAQEKAATDRALALQASEYERRLEALNHAHQEARDKERDFLDRATYDVLHRALSDRVAKLEVGASSYVDRDRLDQTMRALEARLDQATRALEIRLDGIDSRVMEVERAKSNLDGRFSAVGLILLGLCTLISALGAVIGHVWK